MGAKIVKDRHYTHDIDGHEVWTLTVQKNDVSSFGRSYTIPELRDIADTIRKFLREIGAVETNLTEPMGVIECKS